MSVANNLMDTSLLTRAVGESSCGNNYGFWTVKVKETDYSIDRIHDAVRDNLKRNSKYYTNDYISTVKAKMGSWKRLDHFFRSGTLAKCTRVFIAIITFGIVRNHGEDALAKLEHDFNALSKVELTRLNSEIQKLKGQREMTISNVKKEKVSLKEKLDNICRPLYLWWKQQKKGKNKNQCRNLNAEYSRKCKEIDRTYRKGIRKLDARVKQVDKRIETLEYEKVLLDGSIKAKRVRFNLDLNEN